MKSSHPIHLFEEHSASLPIWWQAAGAARTIVYLDAHLDLQPIAEAQIQRLKNAQNIDDIRALEAPHHLNRSDRYVFGIENFLYAAHRLGLLDRLIWVVPPHIPRRYTSSLLDIIQQMDGITFSELCSFRPVPGNALRGTLLGLDITLCDYQDLHSQSITGPWYLDIDIDYFVRVPDDQLWCDPAQLIDQIHAQLGEPVLSTVSRAVGSGFTPLSLRFVADYALAALEQDIPSRQHFHALFTALQRLSQGEIEDARKGLQNACKSRPDCAAAHYLLGMVLDQNKQDTAQVQTANKRAVELDPYYAFDLSRVASGFPNRHRPLDSKQLKLLNTQLSTAPSDKQAYAEIAIARLYAASGALTEAWKLLQKQSGDLAGHSDLTLSIAHGLLERGAHQQAKGLLEQAAGAMTSRTNATLSLGDIAFQGGTPETALHHYQQASEYAPAWSLPLQRQAACLKALGETQALDHLSQIIAQRHKKMAALIGNSH